MSRDSNGTFGLAQAPFVAGTKIASAKMNSVLDDVAAGLTDSLSRGGSGGMLADLDLNGHQLRDVGPGTLPTDVPNLGQIGATLANASLRNYVENGQFNIFQRGYGPFTAAGYGVDRWECQRGIPGGTRSFSISAATDADRTAIGDEELSYFLACTYAGGSAAGDFELVSQKIENVRRLAGKTVTLSFWARTTSGTAALGIEMTQLFGSGGSPSTQVTGIGAQALTITSTWKRYTATINVPSAAGKTFGTVGTDCTLLAFWLSAGANFSARASNIGVAANSINFWGVQLENGATASAVEKRPISYEITQCERHYQITDVHALAHVAAAGNYIMGQGSFRTLMRATPALFQIANLGGGTNLASIAYDYPSNYGFRAYATSGTAGVAAFDIRMSASAEQ